MKPRRIALIGFGAIAADLTRELLERRDPRYEIGVLLNPGSATAARLPTGCVLLTGIDGLREFAPALVVEAAGHSAVGTHVRACLQIGLPVVITSVGALHDPALVSELKSIAEANGGRILLPSGALGGLDYVRATSGTSELAVRYLSRKPPSAWKAELRQLGYDPDNLTTSVTLFRGSAREAASKYPSNLNVAAALALAGAGLDNLDVAVVVDPKATGNTHTIQGESELGTVRIEIVNRPSPQNPKSSWVVSRSLLAAIDQHFSVVVML